jgi:organic hydroperoxide reductase OsmC/OhrA
MTAPFPHRHQVDLSWESDRHGILTAAHRPALVGGPPPQLGGNETWWSPEHLLVAAAALCLMTTFLSLAEREDLVVHGYKSSGEGVVDKTPEGIAVASIAIDVDLKVTASAVAHAASLMEKAKAHCIVSKSMRRPIELRLRIGAV